MKISVDDKVLFSLSEVQKKVIKNRIKSDVFEEDMKRRLKYILIHQYEFCIEDLKKEWIPKLKENGIKNIPIDDDEFAELVFSQPGYQDRKSRDENKRII